MRNGNRSFGWYKTACSSDLDHFSRRQRFSDEIYLSFDTFTSPRFKAMRFIVVTAALLFLSASAYAQAPDLLELELEELVRVKVTTVSRTEQDAFDVPAAVYVLRGSDLQRAGVTNIPDALRLVPGMQVAQVGANQWAINARGPTSFFSNKLLVMIDGRTVYTPSFGGVYWDAQQVMIEDVDRIEVIRGAAASMWGANAVNGVINVISKKSGETQGSLAVAGGGNKARAFCESKEWGCSGHEYDVPSVGRLPVH